MAYSEGWQVSEDAQKLFWRAAINWPDRGLSTTSCTNLAMSTHLCHLLVSSWYMSGWRCTFHLICLAVWLTPFFMLALLPECTLFLLFRRHSFTLSVFLFISLLMVFFTQLVFLLNSYKVRTVPTEWPFRLGFLLPCRVRFYHFYFYNTVQEFSVFLVIYLHLCFFFYHVSSLRVKTGK